MAQDTPPPSPSADWRMAEHWPELVQAVTEQSVDTYGQLMRGLELLQRKGRLSEAEYKVLALPVGRLKRCAVSAQQVIRFQGGRVRQSHEKIDLAYLLECVLQERRDDLAMMGITVRRRVVPVDVLLDPALGYALIMAMLEWCTHFGNRLELRLDADGEPVQARLTLRVRGDDPDGAAANAVFDDGIHWLLLRQIAASDGGVEVTRAQVDDGAELCAAFKRTLAVAQQRATAQDTNTPDSVFHSVSGAYVVVCSPDDTLRAEALGLIRKLGIQCDGMRSPEEALGAGTARTVHLLVVDEALGKAPMLSLEGDMRHQQPRLAVVEIVADAQPSASAQVSRVPRDTVPSALGSAVMFALSRAL